MLTMLLCAIVLPPIAGLLLMACLRIASISDLKIQRMMKLNPNLLMK